MRNLSLVFPGQGSQKVGMGHAFYENFPAAKAIFDQADDVLSRNLSKLIFAGDPQELTRTDNTQPALFTVCQAIIAVLKTDAGLSIEHKIQAVAGHSLGEYAALTTAGTMTFEDGLKLLDVRGRAMQAANVSTPGSMAALLGMSDDDLQATLVAGQTQGTCVIANDNAPGQIVISGTKPAIEYAASFARETFKAKAIVLEVGAPFHSPLMQPAAEAMAQALTSIKLQAPLCTFYANVTATPENDPERIKALLVDQICGRVRWTETVQAITKLSEGMVQVEIGAGKVLTGLAKRIAPEMETFTIQTPEDLDLFVKSYL